MSSIASPGGGRHFGAALVASLAMHGAAMTLSPPALRLAALEAPAPLQVRLAESRPPPPASPAGPKKPSQPLAMKPKAAKAPEVVEAPKVAAEALEPVAAPEETPAPVAVPVPEPVFPATTPPPLPVAVYTPAPPAPQLSAAELLAGYGKAVSQALARYKEYPRIAQMRGWEGAVLMELRVAPSGRLLGAELHTSSGYPVLDEQALAMAARAVQLPVPPEGLRDGAIAVRVPVVFRLTP